MKLNRLSSILALIVLFLNLAPLEITAGDKLTQLVGASYIFPPQNEGPGAGQVWVVRAYYTDRQMVNDLARWTEPWEVHHDQGYVVVEVDQIGYDRLLRAGFQVEIDQRLTAQLNAPNMPLPGQVDGIPGYPCYRTVEETFATAQGLANDYPDLVTWNDAGNSWEKTTPGGAPGYDMMVLVLTNQNIAGPKPKLFITSSIHAREYAPAELATRFAEYLVENYGSDADATWLLDEHEIHLMLHANPDGRKHAEAGLSWRKNTNENYCSPTSNYRGADLNRNFEFKWGCCGGSSGAPCDETYRGPSAASEPETQAVQNYLRAIFPDQRDPNPSSPAPEDATGVYLDIHSYGKLVLWPWGYTSQVAPNGPALQTLGRKLAYFNEYEPDQAIGLYPTDGTTDDFGYGDLGVAAYTYELGTAFFQNCSLFENTILPDNLASLLYAAKVVRTPYLTPAGPDTYSISVTPGAVQPGDPIQLSATIDDRRYENSNGSEPTQKIQTAEYYIDIPPWSTTGTPDPHPMAAADGSFDQKTETVNASIDTNILAPGRHLVYMRGQDADGNWGAISAAFIYLLDPVVDPTIHGYIYQADSLVSLEGTVTAGPFDAHSDPGSGYYSMQVLSGTYDLTASAAFHWPEVIPGQKVLDYNTYQLDFYLEPICMAFSDDVESGEQGWVAQLPWAITTEASHSASHAWTDSPGGNYSNNINKSLVSPSIDLTGYENVALSFWHTYDIEAGWDFGYVEYSLDGGTNWTTARVFDGETAEWEQVIIELPALDWEPDMHLRFRLKTDEWITQDGWHIDDIIISGSGPACAPDPMPYQQYLPVFIMP